MARTTQQHHFMRERSALLYTRRTVRWRRRPRDRRCRSKTRTTPTPKQQPPDDARRAPPPYYLSSSAPRAAAAIIICTTLATARCRTTTPARARGGCGPRWPWRSRPPRSPASFLCSSRCARGTTTTSSSGALVHAEDNERGMRTQSSARSVILYTVRVALMRTARVAKKQQRHRPI
jgi:hypothetical protein